MNAVQETARRRTLAIISHPDAGKTTLTEKLLLYGGAVQLAGSVTARRNQRTTTSTGWSSKTARHLRQLHRPPVRIPRFRRQPARYPGHRDFSEDTYRVLMAVDAVIMVIDAAKGSNQTRKLLRNLPSAGHSHFHVHEQARPAGPASARDCSTKSKAPPASTAGLRHELAARRRRRLPRGVRPPGRGWRTFSSAPSAGPTAPPRRLHSIADPMVCATAWRRTCCRTGRRTLDMLDAAGEAFDEEAVRSGDISSSSAAPQQLRRPAPAGLLSRPRPAPRPAAGRRTDHRALPIPPSPVLSSRSSRTWIPTTATRSPSCASAPAFSSAT